jgi:hypothetical protein
MNRARSGKLANVLFIGEHREIARHASLRIKPVNVIIRRGEVGKKAPLFRRFSAALPATDNTATFRNALV